jgi:hypothetical protein
VHPCAAGFPPCPRQLTTRTGRLPWACLHPGTFFSCVDGATPGEQLKRGIYSEIAVALKGGPWREASMAMLGMAFGLSKKQTEAMADGQDLLSQGLGSGKRLVFDSLDLGLITMRSGLERVGRLSRSFMGSGSLEVRSTSQSSRPSCSSSMDPSQGQRVISVNMSSSSDAQPGDTDDLSLSHRDSSEP